MRKYHKLRKQKRRMYRETWELENYAWRWLTPRIKMYKKACNDIIELYGDEANHFEFEGKTYSQGELIDIMLDCINEAEDGDWLFDEVKYKAVCKFWKIWSIIFPAMWW